MSAIAAIEKRFNYYHRIASAYLTNNSSQLSFWHERPALNENFRPGELGEYYMTFTDKADYSACRDPQGVPMLDYRGAIGPQYNPIAIAQYGLANYNHFAHTGDAERLRRCLVAADWMVQTLVENPHGVPVWNHHFNWEYRDTLKAPWYSGLAQGQGVSLLLRAHLASGDHVYLESATRAMISFSRSTDDGGVMFRDPIGRLWLEEYLVTPPTHILNGFIWGSWGILDYSIATGDVRSGALFNELLDTLRAVLPMYDVGFWSLYEQSGTRLPMLASNFYHRLHIVQLRILHRITNDPVFKEFADRWQRYSEDPFGRRRAFLQKAMFKLCYY